MRFNIIYGIRGIRSRAYFVFARALTGEEPRQMSGLPRGKGRSEGGKVRVMEVKSWYLPRVPVEKSSYVEKKEKKERGAATLEFSSASPSVLKK